MKLDRKHRRLAVASLLAAALAAPARADRIHLDGGGEIETESWRVEGDWVYCESHLGQVGLPRSMVVRIDGPSAETSAWVGPQGTEAAEDPAREPTLEDARAALERRDFETAGRVYGTLLVADPTATEARVGAAVSAIALGRDGLALSIVLDGLARHRAQPELLELLGDLRDRSERVEDALAAWREAVGLKASERVREKIARAERELAVGRAYHSSSTTHFLVRYDGVAGGKLADEVLEFLERRYWELEGLLRHAPGQPITVLLYPVQDFREVTEAPAWVSGLYDGKIRVPLATAQDLDPRMRGLLMHELTHAFVHSKTRGACPRWLHEGLAQRMEGKTLAGVARVEAQEAARAACPPVQPSGKLSYPGALSLTQFLESQGGLDRLVTLLERLGEGRELDAALRATYSLSLEELCRSWATELAPPERR